MNPLLDTEQITKNMRTWAPHGICTLAKRHRPFAISVYGAVMHKVIGVRLDWWNPEDLMGVLAVYECGAASRHSEFFYRMPQRKHPAYRRCPRCF